MQGAVGAVRLGAEDAQQLRLVHRLHEVQVEARLRGLLAVLRLPPAGDGDDAEAAARAAAQESETTTAPIAAVYAKATRA